MEVSARACGLPLPGNVLLTLSKTQAYDRRCRPRRALRNSGLGGQRSDRRCSVPLAGGFLLFHFLKFGFNEADYRNYPVTRVKRRQNQRARIPARRFPDDKRAHGRLGLCRRIGPGALHQLA